MEAKISQDAPGSSLQVRTVSGQAKSFHGHLADCENAVWQAAPATARADSKVRRTCIHSPHLFSAVQEAGDIKITYRSSILAAPLSKDVILVMLLYGTKKTPKTLASIEMTLLLERLLGITNESCFWFSCSKLCLLREAVCTITVLFF